MCKFESSYHLQHTLKQYLIIFLWTYSASRDTASKYNVHASWDSNANSPHTRIHNYTRPVLAVIADATVTESPRSRSVSPSPPSAAAAAAARMSGVRRTAMRTAMCWQAPNLEQRKYHRAWCVRSMRARVCLCKTQTSSTLTFNKTHRKKPNRAHRLLGPSLVRAYVVLRGILEALLGGFWVGFQKDSNGQTVSD